MTDDTTERRLVTLLCGTRPSRQARAAEAAALFDRTDPARLLELLDRLQLAVLLGGRLQELVGPLDPGVAAEIAARTAAAREHGRAQEMVALGVLASLEQAGIRALGLKGAILARQLYDDAGARTSGDIDILVATEDLAQAVAVVQRMGWRLERPAGRGTRLPVLHETLTHPTLPNVELHWRVHWYETAFAPDALARAERPAPREPLIMAPADGLAALTLFYARDGFSGLKMAADVAAWWDRQCAPQDAGELLGGVSAAYPALAGALWVGARLLSGLVGLPGAYDGGPRRWQIASELATPFVGPMAPQVGVHASLVDLLLTPPAGRRASVRREVQKIPKGLERPLRAADGPAAYWARSEHLLRVIRRWTLAFFPAAARAYRTDRPPRALSASSEGAR